MLGSSLFLVYARSQDPNVHTFNGNATLRLTSLQHGAAADVILFKVSFWWAT